MVPAQPSPIPATSCPTLGQYLADRGADHVHDLTGVAGFAGTGQGLSQEMPVAADPTHGDLGAPDVDAQHHSAATRHASPPAIAFAGPILAEGPCAAGTWTPEETAEFEAATVAFEAVDEDL